MTHRAGVLGSPVGHSLSPLIHNAGYAAAGLREWHYTAHEVTETGLGAFVAGRDRTWVGLSLTMPLKHAALEVADSLAPLAATIGAANTLVREAEGGWRAENTDAPGIIDALLEAGVRVGVGSVAVLGAGGTARAALAAARDLGAGSVTVYARRPAAAAALEPVAEGLGLALTGASWAAVAQAVSADVVVSTVPKGVADPLGAALPWRSGTVLLDVLYDPWPTALASAAAAAGCRVVSGLALLLAQAARQFTLFTGVAAPVAPMRAALLEAVASEPVASEPVASEPVASEPVASEH